MQRKIIIALITLAVIGVAATALRYMRPVPGRSVTFKTIQITRGDLIVTVSATGTVEPEEVIDVGAQVAGRIVSFGKDAEGNIVDYGSLVEKETVLAKIDDLLYAADAAKARGEVESANAGVQRAKAELREAEAGLYQAEQDWNRARKVGTPEALSRASYDAYKSAYETAKANVAVKKAAIQAAEADLIQAKASLQRAQWNLGYCTIRSPVKGVVIDRRVNIGQTVVASLDAPSLFLLAKDLGRMQVWVAVNEADIGKIKVGQHVTFTVDALPGENFEGEVGKIRLNASMSQNVVTYTVEVVTDNSDGRLLPYLTANIHFEVAKQSDVLQVPNTALNWRPAHEQIDPEYRVTLREQGQQKTDIVDSSGQGVLWTRQGKYLRPLKVRTGITDGMKTEVEGEELVEGLEVVAGEQTRAQKKQKRQEETSTPFMQELPSGPGGGLRR